MSEAPSPCTRAGVPAREGCPVRGPCRDGRRAAPAAAAHRWPREHAGVAQVHHLGAARRAARQRRARRARPRTATRTAMSISSQRARRKALRQLGLAWRGRNGHVAGLRMEGLGALSQRPHHPVPLRPAAGRRPGQAARLCIAATPETDDLEELKELLRTAGVATVGELVQKRDSTASEPLPRPRQGRGGQAADQGVRRERRRRRRRAHAAPAAQPRGRARRPRARPHRGDPRHLRQPRLHRRGQDAGRARPARIQHGPHARPVDAPRAPRRRPRRRRHRHPWPGRVADRDRPPARARPHHRPEAPARSRQGDARDPARRARARAPAERRAGRLHQRRQVDAVELAHGLRGRRPRPALPHARSRRRARCAARPHRTW